MPAKDPNDDPRFLPSRRELGVMALAATMMPSIVAAAVEPADVRLLDLGPENGALARRAGVWNVVETIWPAPGATPKVIRGQVAERRMIGALLQEVLKASPDPVAAIHRMDYTHFDRVEGRWDYVSMEMRAPVAIMPAWSFDRGEDDAFTVVFAPFAVAGSGLEVAGRMLRMMQLVKRAGPDRDVKQQHFVLADGTGTSWLAHEYVYTRREP